MKYSILLFVLLFPILSLSSQEPIHRCHSTEVHEHHYNTDADYRHDFDTRMVELEQIKEDVRNNDSRINCIAPIIIPVAVHYEGVTNQDMQCLTDLALSQIDVLNQDFNATNPDFANYAQDVADSGELTQGQAANDGVCVTFCLADADHPAGFGLSDGDYAITINQDYVANNSFPNFTQGQWSGYLNIFVTSSTGNIGLLGYSPLFGNGNGSGVVIGSCVFGAAGTGCGNTFGSGGACPASLMSQYNLGRTVTHEVGHYLGCNHPWGQGNAGTESCTNDDGFADTPNSEIVYSGCPTIGASSTSCGSQDMYMNFMDYSQDMCTYMFSEQQAQTMNNTASNIWGTTSVKCSSTVTENDASITQINFPQNFACGASFAPNVRLRNVGSNDLTSVDIVYSGSNGGGSNTFNWTGQMAQNDLVDVVLPAITNPGVDFVLNVSVSNPNGATDENPANDGKQEVLTVIDGTSLPFAEAFEDFAVPFPAQGITISNPDEDNYAWDRRPGASAYGTGIYSAYFNNFVATNGIGNEDWFILPEMDASGFNSIVLNYDYAYNYFSSGAEQRVDSLAIYYSLGCTGIWQERWIDGGASLATAAAPSDALFIPNPNADWTNTSIGINTDGNDFIRVAFVNKSGRGNAVYLDNINISGSTAIVANTEIEELETFNVSPNPSRGTLNVQLEFVETTDYAIRIYDMIGREIHARNGSSPIANETFDMANLANGIYFVSVQSGDKIVTEKVILAK